MEAGKPLAALVYIALAPGGRAKRDRVAELIWPGDELREARHSLRQALYRIRRATGGVPLVQLRGAELEVLPAVRFDCLEGERGAADHDLSDAHAALRGSFLEGFSIPESREFETWRESQRVRFDDARDRVAHALTAQLLQTGDPSRALEIAEELTAASPFSDRAMRLTMAALAAMGRQATALARYHAYDELARRELDAEPGPELAEYARQLAAQVESRPEPSVARLPFVGRAREWAALEAAWEEARRGHGAMLLIEGAAGLGKSRLIDELTARVRGAGGVALIGRSYDVERAVPYGAIADTVSPIVRRPEVAGLSPSWLAEAARLLPELHDRFPHLPGAPEHSGSPAAKRRLHESLARCVEAVAEEAPVLLAVDDVHWADVSSLEILYFLSHRLRGAGVLLLASYRPVDLGPAPRHFARSLCSTRLADLLTLAPLTAADVLDLLTRLGAFDDDATGAALAEHLEKHTGGSPLFLNEVLNTLARTRVLRVRRGRWETSGSSGVAGVPHTLGKLMTDRIQALPPWMRACAEVLAVAAEAPLEVVAEVLQLSEPRTELALAVLEEERLVTRAHGHVFALVHDEFRRMVTEAIDEERRRSLHLAVGAALESRGESKRPGGAARLAFHFEMAGVREPMQKYALAAGAEAHALAAPPDHLAHLDAGEALASSASPTPSPRRGRSRSARRRTTLARRALTAGAAIAALYLASSADARTPRHRAGTPSDVAAGPAAMRRCDGGAAPTASGSVVGETALRDRVPRGWVITASRTWTGNTLPEDAFDGDTTTKWNAGGFPGLNGQWIQVDFGSPRTLVGIQANVEQVSRLGLRFFTSHEIALDGVPVFDWSGQTADGEVLSHTFATPRTARVVRITTTRSQSWVAWSEISFTFAHAPVANCRS